MKKPVFLIISLCAVVSVFGQEKSAEMIVKDFVSLLNNNPTSAEFTLNILDHNDNPTLTQNGSFKTKGDKFVYKLDDIEVFYNGKTLWSYSALPNEVNITQPDETDLVETHPITILTDYMGDYSIRYSDTDTSATEHIIEMKSKFPADDFEEIEARFRKSDGKLSSLKIWGLRFNMTVFFKSFNTGGNIDDSNFVFDTKNYPGVFINDLR